VNAKQKEFGTIMARDYTKSRDFSIFNLYHE